MNAEGEEMNKALKSAMKTVNSLTYWHFLAPNSLKILFWKMASVTLTIENSIVQTEEH